MGTGLHKFSSSSRMHPTSCYFATCNKVFSSCSQGYKVILTKPNSSQHLKYHLEVMPSPDKPIDMPGTFCSTDIYRHESTHVGNDRLWGDQLLGMAILRILSPKSDLSNSNHSLGNEWSNSSHIMGDVFLLSQEMTCLHKASTLTELCALCTPQIWHDTLKVSRLTNIFKSWSWIFVGQFKLLTR